MDRVLHGRADNLMNLRRRKTEAAELFAERRKREDDAPRLKDRVHDLATLNLDV